MPRPENTTTAAHIALPDSESDAYLRNILIENTDQMWPDGMRHGRLACGSLMSPVAYAAGGLTRLAYVAVG